MEFVIYPKKIKIGRNIIYIIVIFQFAEALKKTPLEMTMGMVIREKFKLLDPSLIYIYIYI